MRSPLLPVRLARHRILAPIVALALLTSVAGCATPTEAPNSEPAATADGVQANGTTPGYLATDGSQLVDSDGEPVQLRAVNWFGLETSSCMPHGLWQRSLDDIMDQIASVGFTALRLPYANQCLEASPEGLDEASNPDLVGKTSIEVMDAVISAAKARDMVVLLDRHRPDYDAQSELWYTDEYPEERYIEDWLMLAERYAGDPTVIGADLHNEPHGPACWGCGDESIDWAAAAQRVGNAILEVNPDWLIVVEGVEGMSDGTTTWWGGGLADAAESPVELLIPGRLVYSVHDYPASLYEQDWFTASDYPENLPAVWDRNWGYLVKQDIAPVLLGEFGTRYATESDRIWLASLVDYIDENNLSFAFWSWNPNSGDTGGLVKDDWTTLEQEKLDALAPLLSGD